MYNIKWLRMFYKPLGLKKQSNTRAGARNPKTESCHNANLAAPGGIGVVAWQPAVSPAPTMPAPLELLALSEEKF